MDRHPARHLGNHWRISSWIGGLVLASVLLALLAPLPAVADDGGNVEDGGVRLDYGFELKGHYRDTDDYRFGVPFRVPPSLLLPGEESFFFEPVETGSHGEISNLALWLNASWGKSWSAKVKVDLIDLHDRNPTSDDKEIDLDELWIRWGHETRTAEFAEDWGLYAKLGKFAKFERQNDRHLESYGLLSTAFNRFEDVGLELGFDLGRRIYLKTSLTQGNPLFLRDPNALAGDNGIALDDGRPNLDPERGSGLPIFYDADIDVIDFEHPEVGLGLGVRLADAREGFGAEVLFWGYDRDLADSVQLTNTLYGGDLDLLLGPGNGAPLAVTNDQKRELGANLWLYWGGFSLFAQIVDQDLAGMTRDGWEVEAAWDFSLPYAGAAFGRQLFPFVAPVVRYSELDPGFTLRPLENHPGHPAASARWDWEKIDIGFRLGLLEGLLDLTVEWNLNEFIRPQGVSSADEFLATIRWMPDWGR